MKSPDTLTNQELEIMKAVWERGSATVRDVYEALLEKRKIAYTTVMTMMNILEQKKFLKRKSTGDRAFVYQPVKPRNQVIRSMVQDFIGRVFNGAAEPLLVQMVRDRQISPEDLERIIRMAREQERKGDAK